jgi:C_GCAxxG_C_C family probable redox protein
MRNINMPDTVSEKAYELGFNYEKNYGGCAQCAIGALYEMFPELKNEAIFKSATGLGGGIGLTTFGSCGALAGTIMVLSQIYGRELENIEDVERKRFVAYRLSEKLVNKFLNEYGTVTCSEIQRKLMGKSFYMYEEWEAFLEAGGHSTACTTVVGNATRWAANLIVELENRGIDEVIDI